MKKLIALFLKELRFRPAGFLLGVIAASAMAASVVGARGFLAAHDAKTEGLVASLEERARERMRQLRNDARVFSKSLGFNILLLPEGQDVGALYTDNRSTHFFDPETVRVLGSARLAMLNHLLPMLRHRIYWEAYGGDVVLMGVEGEIYIKAPEFQKPIEERIEPGFVHAGNAIRRKLDLSVGDRVEILGEFFTVRRMLPEKGNVDDISLLMNLTDVQRLAELPGKVGGILALSCECAGDGTDLIRSELDSLVPNVQVVEFTVRARARKRARDAVAQRTEEEINDIRGSRGAMRDQMTRFAALLIALVTGGAVTLLFVLTLVAVRERRVEMAMLRALGLPSSRVVVLLLLRTTVTGLAGGVAGCGLGALAAHYAPGQSAAVSLSFMACVMGATVLIAIVASGIPAALAARTDPAVILNQE